MSFHSASRRRTCLFGGGLLALACLLAFGRQGLIAQQEPVDPGLAQAADAAEALAVAEALLAGHDEKAKALDPSSDEWLASKVEVHVPPVLRDDGKNKYSLAVRVENVSRVDLEGPIRVAVRSVSVENLKVLGAHGTIPDGSPFFEFVPQGEKLLAGKSTRTLTFEFEAADRLSLGARREFEMDWLVTRKGLLYSGKEKGERLPTLAERGKLGNRGAENPARWGKAVEKTVKTQDKWTGDLLKIPGVIGTATAMDGKGRPSIKVYARFHSVEKKLPKELDGVPVFLKVTDRFRPLAGPPGDNQGQIGLPEPGGRCEPDSIPRPNDPCDNNTDPQARQSRPVSIGTQVSNIRTTSGGGCEVGTFGCRVRRGRFVFMLSNNHVIAATNAGAPGDEIVQPGCGNNPADTVATLAEFVPIDFSPAAFNRVDCAIASSTTAQIRRTPPCFAYGTPRQEALRATLGLRVKKVGRTTGLTFGVVTAINVTAFVDYGAPNGIATFSNQFEITDLGGGSFSAGGDSGSLIVADTGLCPTGLLFAGNSTITLANDFLAVLQSLRVEMDGFSSGN